MDAISDSRGMRLFGDVRIEWMVGADDASDAHCVVQVQWFEETVVEAMLDRNRPSLDFDIHREAMPTQHVSGVLSFDAASACLRLVSLRFPGGSASEQPLFPDAADPQAEPDC